MAEHQTCLIYYFFLLFQTLFVLECCSAARIRFNPENDLFFSDCPDQPKNVLSIRQILDLTDLSIAMKYGMVDFAGNMTSTWRIQKSDRLQVRFELWKFDRGSWVRTMYNILVKSFCPLLFDPNQYWYQFWSKYVINAEEIKENCFNVPGTIIAHDPFTIDMLFDVPRSIDMSGHFKIIIKFYAFDRMNVQRDTNMCTEILGELDTLDD
ncbi:hypothetical protein KR222_005238 [Zaprionus bogoriensis]|nr:hypothetical protein KR222_005238 [Zaprionus bogoriensis]